VHVHAVEVIVHGGGHWCVRVGVRVGVRIGVRFELSAGSGGLVLDIVSDRFFNIFFL
jgi:hypothetical protein